MKVSSILITGCAGFIGSTLSKRLISQGYLVVGVDNLNTAYNPIYKKHNLQTLHSFPQFHFYKTDILDKKALIKISQRHKPEVIVHLAALTGIRSSLGKASIYEKVNIEGTQNVFEVGLQSKSQLFIFSSSSSIYGNNNQTPFQELQTPDPRSPYAKTKIEAEKLLKKMSKKSKLRTTILRLFSVYGPHGRPDMAPYLFTEAAFSKKVITLFGNGTSARDYTYIDDVVSAFEKVIQNQISNETINVGNSHPIPLSGLIRIIENETKRKILFAKKPFLAAEARITYANIKHAKKVINWEPQVEFKEGMKRFIQWYRFSRWNL